MLEAKQSVKFKVLIVEMLMQPKMRVDKTSQGLNSSLNVFFRRISNKREIRNNNVKSRIEL